MRRHNSRRFSNEGSSSLFSLIFLISPQQPTHLRLRRNCSCIPVLATYCDSVALLISATKTCPGLDNTVGHRNHQLAGSICCGAIIGANSSQRNMGKWPLHFIRPHCPKKRKRVRMAQQAPWKHAAHAPYSNFPTLGLCDEICVRGISPWHATYSSVGQVATG